MNGWWIFQGTDVPHDRIEELPEAPPWRQFTDRTRAERGAKFQAGREEVELVNTALYLRRPLLITGKPGTGKSTLAYAVAHELRLGPVLRWSITTRTTLQSGLYRYDAIARLQDASLKESKARQDGQSAEPPDIGQYIRLGPLGTALLPSGRPRVLLIDEIDKSDIDLPNDLLHIFEEGEFEIPELSRLPEDSRHVSVLPYDGGEKVGIEGGHVRCRAFPFVVLTSNGEREFPPAFLRRCLRLEVQLPDEEKLARIVAARLDLAPAELAQVAGLIAEFVGRRDRSKGDLATDQLLNAVYLAMKGIDPLGRGREELLNALWKSLSETATV